LPLRRLGRASARLSWGDYAPISQPVGGVQEVREVQENLHMMAQRLQQAQAGMHNYIGAMLQGQEEERKRLSREMHDDTLQSLIALDQQRQMAQRALDRDPVKATNHLEQLAAMMDQTIKNLRRLIRDMRPSYIEDLGLAPALEALASQNNMQSDVEVCFTFQGTPRRLDARQELGLFRIAQEALTNALRHAAATRVEITTSYAEHFTLIIHDNGKGFSVPDRPGTFAQAGHYGLMGMVERAEQMGAQFRVDSAPGKGTTIEVRLAMTPQAQA
jgi:two-component system sensor histidine kinase UhpB